ncbi:NAD(P)H-binding protein [Streptomyces sp. NPDC005480]|uniref:SDR family oxidoreductase n=1 Tax=Streptomyces sp. NPDC005480 TaxID=3154880 RepID=UPI0033A3FDBE
MGGVSQIDVLPVLVTGATGRVGRVVIDQLLDAGVPVRALTHRSEAAATLPAKVEVFTGDLTVPESLNPALNGAGAVFLVWTAPPQTAPAVVERLAANVRRVVFLSSPHQTPHPFFQQPNPMAVLHADIERLIAATGLESTIIRPGMLASNSLACGRPRSGPARSSGGLTALPRRHRSTTVTSQQWRRGRSTGTDTSEATMSLRAPNR